MTPKMTAKEKELLAANEQLAARVKELESQLAEAKAVASTAAPAATVAQPSKSRLQAEAALALLKAGPVTREQLKTINEKYPSDPVYFVRTVLKQQVVTTRGKDGSTVYSLPGTEQSADEKKA